MSRAAAANPSVTELIQKARQDPAARRRLPGAFEQLKRTKREQESEEMMATYSRLGLSKAEMKLNLNQSQTNYDDLVVNRFMIIDNLRYRFGETQTLKTQLNQATDAARRAELTKRIKALEIIQYTLQRPLGDLTQVISLATRGDNCCSQRSLITGTLITIVKLQYQNRQREANTLLKKLADAATSLNDKLTHPSSSITYSQLRHFSSHFSDIMSLLERIEQRQMQLCDIVALMNSDFSKDFNDANPINQALSELVSFITDIQVKKQAQQNPDAELRYLIGEHEDDGYYHILHPGEIGWKAEARGYFCQYMQLNNWVCNADVDQVARYMDDASNPDDATLWQYDGSKQADAPIMLCITTKHITPVIDAETLTLMDQELQRDGTVANIDIEVAAAAINTANPNRLFSAARVTGEPNQKVICDQLTAQAQILQQELKSSLSQRRRQTKLTKYDAITFIATHLQQNSMFIEAINQAKQNHDWQVVMSGVLSERTKKLIRRVATSYTTLTEQQIDDLIQPISEHSPLLQGYTSQYTS